jgi:hypothetical protein
MYINISIFLGKGRREGRGVGEKLKLKELK